MTITSKPATDDYRDGYDRVFSKPQPTSEKQQVVDRVGQAMLDAAARVRPWYKLSELKDHPSDSITSRREPQ